MKRYNNLFDKIVSLDNLYLADKKARRNKSSRKDIKEFDQNKEELLKKLQQNLINGTYKTSEYNTFIIREPKAQYVQESCQIRQKETHYSRRLQTRNVQSYRLA